MAYFKYQSTKQINNIRNTPGQPIRQRNYYKHIIRDENELHKIRKYMRRIWEKLEIRIVGIDFRGAKDAGKRIWIASGNSLDHSCRIRKLSPVHSHSFALARIDEDFGQNGKDKVHS